MVGEPLAKSDDPPITLRQHTLEVLAYVEQVTSAYRALWSRVLDSQSVDRLARALPLAAVAHDLGKAAIGFQRSLRERGFRWEFRHEVLSTAILLASGHATNGSGQLAAAAVLTHHRDLTDERLWRDCAVPPLPRPQFLEKARRQFSERAAELEQFWEWIARFLQEVGELPPSLWPRSPRDLEPPASLLQSLRETTDHLHAFRSTEGLCLTLCRGWLLAADHAASAGVPHFVITFPTNWKAKHAARLTRSRARGDGQFRAFQRALGEYEGSALLIAPTGAGKTDAAIRWIARNRISGERVFYILPYQASIEAMGKTLERLFGRETVGTLHARTLEVAFQRYFSGDDYDEAYQAARQDAELNRLVHKPIKVTTPFQLIKWLFGLPRFEVGLAEMVGALVVFDEIHAYDAHVMALILELVRVLRELGARCLFMSATFPEFLRRHIEEAYGLPLRLFRLDQPPAVDAWAKLFLAQARHRVEWTDDPLEELVDLVVDATRAGERVLVVANRVQQAQVLFQRLVERVPCGLHLLHGRLTRRDRVEREQRILAALGGESPESVHVLVATQVVEVSLDISFDRLVTEVAPVDDLLQRFGRVNRYYEHESPRPILISRTYEDALHYVYDRERLVRTLEEAPLDGQALDACDAEQWVERVYREGWTTNEGRRFEQALASFRAVIEGLRPLQHAEMAYEDFYRLFQGTEVLPSPFLEEYTRYRIEGKHLLAQQFLVPVPYGTLWKLQRAGRISQLKDGTLVASIQYDRHLGLLPEVADLDTMIV
ncbi:CRISPR-associated helicase Cas3' [Thermomicrobium sp.]